MAETHSTPARVRPGIVTISGYLLILVAVIQVILLIISLATLGETRRVLEEAYSDSAGTGMDALADMTVAITVVSGLITLLLAVGLVVLALLNNRGKNASRITTWVLGGVLLCCTGGGLLGGLAGSFTGPVGGSSADMPSQEEVTRRLEEALPSWYTPVTLLLNVLAFLALVVALILLALPAANEFFRKPQQSWEPPTPGYPGYPSSGAPGYPPQGQPGYPPAPGYPGYPAPPPGTPGYPGVQSPETPGYPGAQSPGTPGHPPQSDQPGQPSAGESGGQQNPPSGS